MDRKVMCLVAATLDACVHRRGNLVPSPDAPHNAQPVSRGRTRPDGGGVAVLVPAVRDVEPAFVRPTQIVALAPLTPVHAAAGGNARVIGNLAEGAVVDVVSGPNGRAGCAVHPDHPEGGWYQVSGGGYVCVGGTLALPSPAPDFTPPASADLDAAMPYAYAVSRGNSVMYRTLPTLDDLREGEPWRFPRVGMDRPATHCAPMPRPPDRDTLHLADLAGSSHGPVLRKLLTGMTVALDRTVADAAVGESYWRTQGGGYVRENQLSPLGHIPTFHGEELGTTEHLPMAWMNSTTGASWHLVEARPRGTARVTARHTVRRWTAIPLMEGAGVEIGAQTYLRTADGRVVNADDVRRAGLRAPPPGVGANERWIDVDLDEQVLVAYEGERPVFATMVSSGLGDPEHPAQGHETPTGSYRIETRHVTAPMAGNTAAEGPYDIEDVPWVMFYHGAYALHGAYWHHEFGRPMSHGCINLSPPDARRLFLWADPQLPAGWHGVFAGGGRAGSRVEERHAHGVDATARPRRGAHE